MKLTRQRFEDMSKLGCEIYTGSLAAPDGDDFLLVAFKGTYSGGRDARYMSAMVAAALQTWTVPGVVLDLRELTYEWGDEMTSPLIVSGGRGALSQGERSLLATFNSSWEISTLRPEPVAVPTVVIVSEFCRAGLTSLVRDEMKEDPARWLFDTPERAVAGIRGYWQPNSP